MKRGKELKISDVSKNYTITFGTVDNKNPKSVYLNISCWGKPIGDSDAEVNYNRVINNLGKLIKQFLYNNLNPEYYNKDRTIVDLDMRESGIKYDKRSYMCTEITLFQENEYPINSDILYDYTHTVIKGVIDVLDKNPNFKFYKTKK